MISTANGITHAIQTLAVMIWLVNRMWHQSLNLSLRDSSVLPNPGIHMQILPLTVNISQNKTLLNINHLNISAHIYWYNHNNTEKVWVAWIAVYIIHYKTTTPTQLFSCGTHLKLWSTFIRWSRLSYQLRTLVITLDLETPLTKHPQFQKSLNCFTETWQDENLMYSWLLSRC